MSNRNQAPDAAGRAGTLMYVGMWVLVLALLTAGFSSWLESRHNPNRDPGGQLYADGSREVVLHRNRSGHYVAAGAINGQPVIFLLDTGATDTVIPAAVAQRLGLRRGAPRQYRTAHGIITAYLTRIERVQLGLVEVNDVRGSINPHMDGEQILLGMSFLQHLELRQQGETLTLRQQARQHD
jgi:aspartyl protease family protein